MARCVGEDGEFYDRRYRLELGYLARYARRASRRFRATLRRLRWDPYSDDAAQRLPTEEALLCSVPLGVVWHDQPRHAARLARHAVAVTHRDGDVGDVAACMAAAIALSICDLAHTDRVPLAARRAWLERVVEAAAPGDATAASLCTIADLASQLPQDVARSLASALPVLSALRWGFYLALRYGGDVSGAFAAMASLKEPSPAAQAIAGAIVGVVAGADALASEDLQDRDQFVAWGEKLTLLRRI